MATDGFFIFERKAVKALIGQALSPATIDRILREAQIVGLVTSDTGYVIDSTHADLVSLNGKFALPLVGGRYKDTEVRFTATIRGQTLRLKCRSVIPGQTLPSDFRDYEIEITVSQLRASGKPED